MVRNELETFLAEAQTRERPVPRFVCRDLRAYLRCGVLAHGFVRVHCDACGPDALTALGSAPSARLRRLAHSHRAQPVLEGHLRAPALTSPAPRAERDPVRQCDLHPALRRCARLERPLPRTACTRARIATATPLRANLSREEADSTACRCDAPGGNAIAQRSFGRIRTANCRCRKPWEVQASSQLRRMSPGPRQHRG